MQNDVGIDIQECSIGGHREDAIRNWCKVKTDIFETLFSNTVTIVLNHNWYNIKIVLTRTWIIEFTVHLHCS